VDQSAAAFRFRASPGAISQQMIVQKVHMTERDRRSMREYKDRINDIVNGLVKQVEFGNVIIDTGLWQKGDDKA